MEKQKVGIIEYIDPLSDEQLNKMPGFLRLSTATNETILLRLLLGHLHLQCENGKKFELRKNYFYLPCKKAPILTYKSLRETIEEILSDEANSFSLIDNSTQLLKYINMNRKNSNVYKLVLFEISSFLFCQSSSPITAFAHLYRCLEYLSYSFPLVYAAKSKDYKGSFNDLKKFITGDASGELKFFRKFLDTLFGDEASTLDYIFEMEIEISFSLEALKSDLSRIYNDFLYEFDENILKIKYKDMLNFFITTRNRYFHMLIGLGQENFSSIEYDISEYFHCINPYLLNWISMIIQKITFFGFYS